MDLVKTDFEVLDERFARVNGDEWMKRLHTGCRWTEGPAYFPAGRYLVFSDIPNDRTLRWDETTGQVGVFRQPSQYSNGHTVDRAGGWSAASTATAASRGPSTTARSPCWPTEFEGKRFNSPNDVVEHSDGSIWFTDPSYGIDSDYEGYKAESEIGACHVYRVDPSGAVRIVADDFDRPNGLAFSADESLLYIVDTRQQPSHIRVFAVGPEARCPAARSSGRATTACSTASAWTAKARSGRRPTTACTASPRTGR